MSFCHYNKKNKNGKVACHESDAQTVERRLLKSPYSPISFNAFSNNSSLPSLIPWTVGQT